MGKALVNNGPKSRSNPYSGLRYLVVFLACLTLLLLVAGALVTSNEAGDSVPDWPMSFGRWVLGSRQFIGNIRFEYSHRVAAGAVGIMTLLTACWAWLRGTGSGIDRVGQRQRWLALAAVIGVVLQAAIGGVRVLLPGYKALIAVPHAFVAQSFFCAVVTLAVITSRSWRQPRWRQARPLHLDDSAALLRSL